MALTFKVVKPKPFHREAVMAELTREANDVCKQMQQTHIATTRTWKRKPKFTRKVTVTTKAILMDVTTADKIYNILNAGVKRRFIGPKNKSALKFRTVYKAKTRPGLVGSVSGGASGPFAFSKGHYVGPILPRKFYQMVAKMYRRVLPQRFGRAMKRAAKVSGHAYT